MFGFGHDEEVGGGKGAAAIAELLASRKVQLAMINDEGGMLSVDGLKPLTHTPVALIGTAEKVHLYLSSSGQHLRRMHIDLHFIVNFDFMRLQGDITLLTVPSWCRLSLTSLMLLEYRIQPHHS